MNQDKLEDIAMHLGKISRSLELIARSMSPGYGHGGGVPHDGYVAELDASGGHGLSKSKIFGGPGPLIDADELNEVIRSIAKRREGGEK